MGEYFFTGSAVWTVMLHSQLQSRQAEGRIQSAMRKTLQKNVDISSGLGSLTLQTTMRDAEKKCFCAEATAPSCVDGSYFTEVQAIFSSYAEVHTRD